MVKNSKISFDDGLEAILDNIMEPFALINREYRFVYLNSKAEAFFNINEDQKGLLTLWDVFPFEKGSKLSNILIQAFLKKQKVSDDFYSIHHKRWYHVTAYSSNKGIALLFTDIHRKKIAEEILKERESSLKLILNSLPHIAFILEENAELTLINKRWTEYTGMPPEEALGPKWGARLHPDDLKNKMEVWKKKAHTGLPFETEFRVRSAEGDYRWFWDRIVPLVAENGNITLWLGTATDIQHQKDVEQELRQNKAFLENVLKSSPDMILILNYHENKIVYTNEVFQHAFGFPARYIFEHTESFIQEQIHPDDLPLIENFLKNLQNKAEGEHGGTLEHRIKDASGNWRWVLMRSVVFSKTETGTTKEILTFLTDITPLKKARRNLIQSSRLIKQITETTPDSIYLFDMKKQKVLYMNKMIESLGYSENELKSFDWNTLRSLIHPDDQSIFDNYYAAYEHIPFNKINEAEYRAKDKLGNWHWVRDRGRIFKRDENGSPAQFIAIIQDITEKKNADIRKHENEILNELVEKKDEFMSVASHELKTPITTIKASVQLMKRMIERHADEKMIVLFLDKAIQQINKLTTLIGDLLDNAKIQSGKMSLSYSTFRVEDLIEDCLYHNINHHKITVQNAVEQPIEADKTRIEQVLNNFLGNAIKYSPEEKEVILELKEEGDFIKISVTDFGIGIPIEQQEHVFDRFYRVDNKSQEFSGLGLGLYISSEIIRRHQGDYGVSSEIGKGSTFWFKIPIKRPAQ